MICMSNQVFYFLQDIPHAQFPTLQCTAFCSLVILALRLTPQKLGSG